MVHLAGQCMKLSGFCPFRRLRQLREGLEAVLRREGNSASNRKKPLANRLASMTTHPDQAEGATSADYPVFVQIAKEPQRYVTIGVDI